MAAADYFSTVQKIYIAYYNRPADPVGLNYWADQLNAHGGNLATIINSFGTSSEATALYTGMTDVAKINAIYNALFHRDGDLAGLTYYAGKLADGSMTQSSIMLNILNGAQAGVDLAAVTAKVTYATSFTATIDTASELVAYAGTTAAATARAALVSVYDATTLTTQTDAIATTITNIVSPTPTPPSAMALVLTTAADLLTGGAGNDTITGAVDTLSNSDEIHGGAGTDTLTLRLGSAQTATAPTMSGVEVLNIVSRDPSANLNFADIKGVTSIALEGNSFSANSFYNSATVDLVNGFSGTLMVDINSGSVTANGLTLNLNSAVTATLVAPDINTLTLNVNQASATIGSASNFSVLSALTISGTGAVGLKLGSAAGGLQTTAVASLTAINAASAGALTLSVYSAATLNLNISGGANNDTIKFYESFNNADTVAGGAGTDTLGVSVDTALGIRPNVSGVETIMFDVNTALSASFTGVYGATALTLRLGTAAVFSGLGSGVNVINIESGASTAGASVVLGYASAASDVVINLNGGSSTAIETTTQTVTALLLSGLSVAANSGSLSINAQGTASVELVTIAANDAKSVTVSAMSQNILINSAVSFATATTVTLAANTNRSLTISGSLAAVATTALTLNAGGASALVDLSAVSLSKANQLTITTNSAGTGGLMVSADAVVFTASTAAFAVTAIDINAAGGDITLGQLTFSAGTTASASINLQINITGGSTANLVTLTNISAEDIATGQVNFNIGGSATVSLAAFNNATGGLQVNVTTTALTTASTANLQFGGLNASSLLTVTLGNHNGNVLGGAANDTISFGIGSQSANGGQGNDEYNMSSGVNTISINSGYAFDLTANAGAGSTANLGQDTVYSVGAGDIIILKTNNATAYTTLLTGANIRSASTAVTGLSTGGILNAAWTSVSTAALVGGPTTAITFGGGATIANPFAIYTSNGDTIIEVLLGTAGPNATALAITTASFVRFVLDGKDITSISAAFTLDVTTTGISLSII